MAEMLTAREAAFVLDIDYDEVVRELDARPDGGRLQAGKGGVMMRHLPFVELVFLRAVHDGLLSASGKAELRAALVPSEHPQGVIRLREMFLVDTDKIGGELREKIAQLDRLKESVELADDDIPRIRGTTIEVHRVAALAATSIEEAKFDYPSLSEQQIQLALQYANVYPKAGRPFPAKSLKRMLLNSNLGELNKVVAEGRKNNKIFSGPDDKTAR